MRQWLYSKTGTSRYQRNPKLLSAQLSMTRMFQVNVARQGVKSQPRLLICRSRSNTRLTMVAKRALLLSRSLEVGQVLAPPSRLPRRHTKMTEKQCVESRDERGYTLVEALVVMMIFGVVFAIIMGVLIQVSYSAA